MECGCVRVCVIVCVYVCLCREGAAASTPHREAIPPDRSECQNLSLAGGQVCAGGFWYRLF